MSSDPFAPSYREARRRFLDAAEAAGLDAQHEPHPLVGRDGEALALDIVVDGPRDAERLLILSSGCHGIEGYCGSGLQVALLQDAAFRAEAREAGVAVLHLHALNPWGMSWWRRTTQENVDLNRNFRDFHAPPPPNPGYDELHPLLLPHDWPPSDAVRAALAAWIAAHGERAFQAAVSQGQATHPQGLFFAGLDPTWSHVALRHALRAHATRCRRLAWIDVHTGLGPQGHGERIYAGPAEDHAALARARAWWGEVTSIWDGSSASAKLTGMLWQTAYEECAQAAYTGIALEFGTHPISAMLETLCEDQWYENHPEVTGPARAAAKARMFAMFFVDTPAWREAVLAQGLDAAQRALRGLAAA